MRVSHQLRIPVGPPSASIATWVIDPVSDVESLEIDRTKDRRMLLRVNTTFPATTTTTTSSTTRSTTIRGTIFILHGLSSGREVLPYEIYAIYLARRGYRVILPDLRGHGRSTGKHITYGPQEARDLKQVLDEVVRQSLAEEKIGVVGVSYGAATAIHWAAIDARVCAVVALESFSSLRDASKDAGPQMLGPFRWMFLTSSIRKSVDYAGKYGGFDPNTETPLNAITKFDTPVLLFHGADDTFLLPDHSRRLHAAAQNHSKLEIIEGAHHFTLWLVGMDRILGQAMKLFDETLK